MIDKSIRADYEMQGKVKNYLGKQKMVKAPKKWKSAPNHPETELAYITKAEKDALIKMNMYGSMNGKANKGPSGIISLNGWGDRGDTSDRSYGGGNVSGGGDNRDYGGGRAAEARSAAAAATQEAARVAAVNAARDEAAAKAKRDMQATIAEAEKAEAIKNAQKTMVRINKPFEFPTPKKPTAPKALGSILKDFKPVATEITSKLTGDNKTATLKNINQGIVSRGGKAISNDTMRKTIDELVNSDIFNNTFHQEYNQFASNQRDAGNTQITPRAKAYEEYIINKIQTNPNIIQPDKLLDQYIF